MSKRYELLPQMEAYDRLGHVYVPYLMYFHSPNFVSEVVNTNSKGFRHTYMRYGKIKELDEIGDRSVSILVGGSSCFGIGASSDKATISSQLSLQSDDLWLNFGGRAFNSTQEFMLFLNYCQYFARVKRVVVFSGLNNLTLFYLSSRYSKDYGTIFNWTRINQALNDIGKSRKRKLLEFLLHLFFGDTIDYSKTSEKELLKMAFRHRKGEEFQGDDAFFKSIKNHNDLKDDILIILKRDIQNWKSMSQTMNFELYYFLQPFSNWIQRELSGEEKEVFSELDRMASSTWLFMSEHMNYDIYLWYQQHIREICAMNNIPFFDMNEFLNDKLFDGIWLFADRVHMTDIGYRIMADEILEKIL